MTLIERVCERLTHIQSYPGRILSETNCRISSVLIPLVIPANASSELDVQILYEKRAAHIPQGGEICFPGGKIEPGEDSRTAALREYGEETGLPPEDLLSPAYYGSFFNSGGLLLHVWMAVVPDITAASVNDEVEKLFCLSLNDLQSATIDSYNMKIQFDSEDGNWLEPLRRAGLQNYRPGRWRGRDVEVLFYKGFEELLWGLSAKVTREFVADFLASNPAD